jgi:6-phosphofructokinase 1
MATTRVTKGNAVIGQSGGPTAVINQSLVGVIESMKGLKDVGKLLGARHGVRGIVEENFISLKGLAKGKLEAIAATPAAALGSSRDKPDEAYCEKIFHVFEKHNVRYFFYIGGNDSADTARIINEMAAASGYDDRDSASLPGIKINVVMGRNAGWLTAAAALGRQDESCGPHLVYLPEVPFKISRFLADVKKTYAKLGRCQIAVSEGIADATGQPVTVALAEKLGHRVERDSHGNVQLSGTGALGDFLSDFLKGELSTKYKKVRVRADTFGYLQRSFAGYASSVDQAEARMVGRKAVEFAAAGNVDGSVAIKRLKGPGYKVKYVRAKLSAVARLTKDMPRSYINKAGNGVTGSFLNYAMPLVGKLPTVGKLF